MNYPYDRTVCLLAEPMITRSSPQPVSPTVPDTDRFYRVGPACTNAAALVGRTVTFACTVSSRPPAEVKWTLPSGRVLRQREAYDRITAMDNGNLRIADVQSTDQGLYWCHASNRVGEDSDSCSLTVIGKWFLYN